MTALTLYCKSYSTDLLRVVRLAQSIQQYNTERLPFFVSVPKAELQLFHSHLVGLNVELIADEDILHASPNIDAAQLAGMSGGTAQQVIKSEFWRLNQTQTYVCLDSDAMFIRPFGRADFLAVNGTPYTVLDEAHDLLEDALRQGRQRIVEAFNQEANLVQRLFGRTGRQYSFGPFPLVWHRDVWQSLDEHYLKPRRMSFAEAIKQAPIESRWYGEALLAYKAVPLLPCQALFKVYHYAWQFDKDKRSGLDATSLAQMYCGVIYQSSWDRKMDWPHEGGSLASKVGRRIRRRLGRI
jgi:hypothetical protein